MTSVAPDPIEQEVQGRPNAPTVYSADDIERAIEYALRDREFRVVVTLLKMLALKDADRADAVLKTIQLGLDVAMERGIREAIDG